jgi:hypothetical protein
LSFIKNRIPLSIDPNQCPSPGNEYAHRLEKKGSIMSMSFYELYVWLSGLDFPSLFTIWTWLITVPWWLAIITVMLIIFAVRVSWSMTCYYLNWLFDWTFKAGERFGEWLNVAKGYIAATLKFGRLIRTRLFG